MEEKLAQYRAQRAKDYEAKKQTDGGNAIKKGWQFLNNWKKPESKDQPVERENTEKLKEQKEPLVFNTSGRIGDEHVVDSNQSIISNPNLWKGILWLTLWGLFLELGFGAVYFIVSVSFILYKTMRSGSRNGSEPSAYSVFNPNCERIDGTFTAEQFERELRFGPASVH